MEDDRDGAHVQAKMASGASRFGHDFGRLRVRADSEPRGARAAVPAVTLGRADDPAEREADAIASAIVRGEAHASPSREPPTSASIQAKGVDGQPCPSQDTGQDEEEERPAVQAKAEGSGAGAPVSASFASALSARQGGGAPLPAELRSSFQSRLGGSLGDVRLHTDTEAGHLARSIGAEAFTSGQHVYFAPGRYAPDTPAGQHLLAHELVHVVQQRGGGALGPIRRYTLSGFDPAQTTAMNTAIPIAKTKVLGCAGKGVPLNDLIDIERGLNNANFLFDPELDICGWTHPFTSTIKVGAKAFNRSKCCDLESTLAHECGHAFAWMIESSCRKMECKCFGCSC